MNIPDSIKLMREVIRKQDNYRQNNNPLPEEWAEMYLKLRDVVLDFLVKDWAEVEALKVKAWKYDQLDK